MLIFLNHLINGISLGSVYAIIALGYTMVYGIAKMLNFAHGDVIMVGAYVCFFAVASYSLPPVVGILLAVAGVLVGRLPCTRGQNSQYMTYNTSVSACRPLFRAANCHLRERRSQYGSAACSLFICFVRPSVHLVCTASDYETAQDAGDNAMKQSTHAQQNTERVSRGRSP